MPRRRLMQDLREGLRRVLARPAFSGVAVLTLALACVLDPGPSATRIDPLIALLAE